MPEILFRGKRVDNGEWVYGTYGRHTSFDAMIIDRPYLDSNGDLTALNFWTVNPETVGQFTGLTDKNGVKIFEGDIFRFDDEAWSSSYTSGGMEYDSCGVINYGAVGFDDECARFDFVKYKFNENSVEADIHENRNIEFAEFVSDLEIIGNIHDNPGLLEEKK